MRAPPGRRAWPRLLLLRLLPLCGLAGGLNVDAGIRAEPAPVKEQDGPREKEEMLFLPATYNAAMQPLVNVSVGGQWLNLVFDSSSGNTIVFVEEYKACVPADLERCYSYKAAEKRGSLAVCEENNDEQADCENRAGRRYACSRYLESLSDVRDPHQDALIIDGLQFDQKAVEAKDDAAVVLSGKKVLDWSGMPVRLLVDAMEIPTPHSWISLRLFEGAGGILGGSGPTLSCRNQTLWSTLLKELNVSLFAMDLSPPANATTGNVSGPSRIVFNHIEEEYAHRLVWSQPKQTGDLINDGMHEFLMYRLEVCGINMLYNTSSNWLTVIDTSGPCLTLPPFLFDRLMTRIPVECPFAAGEQSLGRLCSPKRDFRGGPALTLPSLSFRLEDAREPEPPALQLPLERLVFRNASGVELLCISRDDGDPQRATADMMYQHIALGSLAVSALYTVVNLENNTVGLAAKGNPALESLEAFCVPSVTCTGMQTYFPPQNLCEDPRCYEYMFMTLDEKTKTCKWSSSVPVAFGALLAALVALELVSHRLYRQAIDKASEYGQ